MDKDKLQKLKNSVSCLFDENGNPDYHCLSEIVFFDSEDQTKILAAIPIAAIQSMVHYLIEHDKLEEVLEWNNKVLSKRDNSLGDFTKDEFVQFDSHQISEEEYEIDERYDYEDYSEKYEDDDLDYDEDYYEDDFDDTKPVIH